MRKLLLALLATSFLFFTACSKDDMADAVRINIIGYVSNVKTKAPLKDVTVEISTSKGISKTKTDKNGKYVFNEIVSGNGANLVKFTKEGYLTDAIWVGGTASVDQLGALPYDETFNGNVEIDSLGSTLKSTIYYDIDNKIAAKNQVVKIIFPCQAPGIKLVADAMATTSSEGILMVEKMPSTFGLTLAAEFNDGAYKFDDKFATDVVSSGNTKEYTMDLVKIGASSFGILSSSFIEANGLKKENVSIETSNFTITFTQAIDTLGLTTGGTKNLQAGLFDFQGSASAAYTQKASLSDDLKTVSIAISSTSTTFALRKATTYSISIPGLTSINKESYSSRTITFKTVK